MIEKNKMDWNNTEDVKRYNKEYQQSNREKIKKYREKNKDKSKKYREENKNKIKIWSKQYYKENKEKERMRHKKYEEENKEKIRIRKKKYYEKHKDEIAIREKKYRDKHKDKIRIREKKYRNKYKDKLKKYRENNKDRMAIRDKIKYEKSKKAICIICGNSAHIKYCSDKCQGIGMCGENNCNWKGGISNDPYSKEWTERFKKSIRDRDNNKCMRCGRAREEFKRALDVHHIDGNPKNTTKENCITLCIQCHGLTKGKEEFFAEGFRNMLKRLYGYEYYEV